MVVGNNVFVLVFVAAVVNGVDVSFLGGASGCFVISNHT